MCVKEGGKEVCATGERARREFLWQATSLPFTSLMIFKLLKCCV